MLKWIVVGLPVIGCIIVFAEMAPPAAAKTCANWEGLEAIRGYCPDDYLRLDLIEERVDAAVAVALDRYFSLDIEGHRFPARIAHLRHGEDPSRGRRWRGEFSIAIEKGSSGYVAELTRPKQPLRVEARRIVYEAYKPIAEAFARSSLKPPDQHWAEQVRRILPPIEAIVRGIRIERWATDGESCPALQARTAAVVTLQPEPLQAPNTRKKPGVPETLPIYLHPEWYEVVVSNYVRTIYVRDLDSDAAFFKWADGTVQAFEPCWQPKARKAG